MTNESTITADAQASNRRFSALFGRAMLQAYADRVRTGVLRGLRRDGPGRQRAGLHLADLEARSGGEREAGDRGGHQGGHHPDVLRVPRERGAERLPYL